MKILRNTMILVACMGLLTSCGSKKMTDEEKAKATEDKEIVQNDYRGGVKRTEAIQDSVIKTIDKMKSNNATIRENNPNSFWTQKGYLDFVVNFLSTPIINTTQWLNEEETEWSSVVKQTGSVENSLTVSDGEGGYSFSGDVTMVRNEKDDYEIDGATDSWGNGKLQGNCQYKVYYDCNRDWCKAYKNIIIDEGEDTIKLPDITTELYEYARLDENTFAIQTGTERLYVKFKEADKDKDIREREIEEFHYSRLYSEGTRTTFKEFEKLPEISKRKVELEDNIKFNSEMAEYPYINEHGDLSTQYGLSDSIFTCDNINKDWVFEDKNLQQGISYSNGNMVIISYNKLSESYEKFLYKQENADESKLNELEQYLDNAFGNSTVTVAK